MYIVYKTFTDEQIIHSRGIIQYKTFRSEDLHQLYELKGNVTYIGQLQGGNGDRMMGMM